MLQGQLPWLVMLLLCLNRGCTSDFLKSSAFRPTLLDEPLLRELFSGDDTRLAKISSCLDSVFKLKRAYEVLYSVKSIYSDFLSNRTDRLTEFEHKLLDFCREDLPIGADAVDAHFRHPVNAHKFVVFTARKMNLKLFELVKGHSGVKLLLNHLVSNTGCWLNEDSVAESIQSLLTLKAFYNISAADFARGNFSGRLADSEVGFTTQELMELLLHLNRQFEPVQVAQMAEYLRQQRRDELPSLGVQPVRSLYRILGKAYYQMKQFSQAVEVLREFKTLFAADDASSSSRDRGIDVDLAYIQANGRGEPADFVAEAAKSLTGLEREFGITRMDAREGFWRYQRLCGAAGLADEEIAAAAVNASANSLLICENWRPYNGWYAVRKEVISVAPLVVRFLDVFTPRDNVTAELMREAEKRIYETPPEDFGEAEKYKKLTQIRLHSFSRPMPALDSNSTKSIIRRIESLTGLDASVNFKSSEKYIDVDNHGHGIRNLPHATPKRPGKFYDGMATALFFPVDDVVGGEIVFPDKKLKIPVKRSDLYVWYNYLPSYHADATLTYFSCPILFGDKWTAKVTLGLTRCSQDQEVTLETLLPGAVNARRRSVARSWKVLIQPKKVVNATVNATDVNATDVHATGVNATGVNATDVNATDVNATDVNATDVNATGVNATGADGAFNPEADTTTVQLKSDDEPTNQTSAEASMTEESLLKSSGSEGKAESKSYQAGEIDDDGTLESADANEKKDDDENEKILD